MSVNTHPILCGSVAGKASKIVVALHDAAYAALQLDFKYVAVGSANLTEVVDGFRALQFRGFGVSMPHKTSVISLLDIVSEEVKTIGACNTVVQRNGQLHGYNTDWRGAIDALSEAGVRNPKSAMILGSGGVARAIGYGLRSIHCDVWIASRNAEAGHKLAQDLRLAGSVPIAKQGSVPVDLVINATPMSDSANGPTILSEHKAAKALLDVVFSPKETPLVAQARNRGLLVAPGWRMLLHQALHQFRLYTDREPPKEQMSKVLETTLE